MDSIAVIGKALGEQYVAVKRKCMALIGQGRTQEYLATREIAEALMEAYSAAQNALRETGDTVGSWDFLESFWAVIDADRADRAVNA